MAGAGQRFVDEGYTQPKPLIEVCGKTILEWTTRSMPFIVHERHEPRNYSITFAIQKNHNKNNNLERFLRLTYGKDTKVVTFDGLTRGNLETAVISAAGLPDDEPILILDADNRYDGSGFENFLNNLPTNSHAVLCVFDPIDEQEKWCFAKIDEASNNQVIQISEKKRIENGFPMMGVFFYSKKKLFQEAAEHVLKSDLRVRNEFYMSQSIETLLKTGVAVYAYKSPIACPLGTPEDLRKFQHENLF